MKKDLKSRLFFSTLLILIVIVGFLFIFITINNYDSGVNKYFSKNNASVENELSSLLDTQKEVDNKINDIISNITRYNIDNPYIINNPYSINPLSSLIIFYTNEELETDVYINGGYMSTIKASKNHIIPIYGLNNNSENIIRIDLSNGVSKDISIKTELYNDYTQDYNINSLMNGSQFLFIVGDRNNVESRLRGFDQKGRLSFYYDLDYISGVSFKNDKIYVGYNSKYNKNNNIPSLKLELDYLGKILSISPDTSDLLNVSNVNLANIDYIAVNQNIYKDIIDNYKVVQYKDDNPTTSTEVSSIDELALLLEEVEDFSNPFSLSINERYLTYDFKDNNDVMLYLINRKGNVYTYKIDDDKFIKLPEVGDYSIYIKINNNYYNLKTILNK